MTARPATLHGVARATRPAEALSAPWMTTDHPEPLSGPDTGASPMRLWRPLGPTDGEALVVLPLSNALTELASSFDALAASYYAEGGGHARMLAWEMARASGQLRLVRSLLHQHPAEWAAPAGLWRDAARNLLAVVEATR